MCFSFRKYTLKRALSESSAARKAQSDLALPRKLSSDLDPSEEDDFDATYADDVKQRMKIWQIVRAILREIDELPGLVLEKRVELVSLNMA